MTKRTPGVTGLILGLTACSGTHAVLDPDAGSDAPAITADAAPLTDAFAPDAWTPPDGFSPGFDELSPCLLRGGGLREVASVFNNDRADHGALLRFALSASGRIAAAGADGTVKFWTLNAELEGEVSVGRVLTYGPEVDVAPVTSLVFDGARVLAGDSRGLVTEFDAEGTMIPRGGATPGFGITAISFDPTLRQLAHAQTGDAIPLMVRRSGEVLELATSVDDIRSLAFGDNDTFWVAGSRGGTLAYEQRERTNPSRVVFQRNLPDVPGTFVEVITEPRGGAYGVSEERVMTLGIERWTSTPGGRSIAVTPDGAVVFVARPTGWAALDATSGRELASGPVTDPVTIRVDSSGRRLVIAGGDAYLHVLACEDGA